MQEDYMYYIKSIVIFFSIYVLYMKFGKYVLIGLLFTIPLFLIYELSDVGVRPSSEYHV